MLATLRIDLEWLGPLVTAFVVAAADGRRSSGSTTRSLPLTEALNSSWLVIHVVSAVIATGAFTLGGMLSALYLVKCAAARGRHHRLPRPAARARGRSTGSSYRMHAFGFPVWTFAVLITGPIWAHQAWSSYWNWDPKEVWAFITWVVYAAYLHARATAGWRVATRRSWRWSAWRRCGSTSSASTTSRPRSQHSYAEGAAPEMSVVLGLAGPVEVAQEVGVVVGADHPRA